MIMTICGALRFHKKGKTVAEKLLPGSRERHRTDPIFIVCAIPGWVTWVRRLTAALLAHSGSLLCSLPEHRYSTLLDGALFKTIPQERGGHSFFGGDNRRDGIHGVGGEGEF